MNRRLLLVVAILLVSAFINNHVSLSRPVPLRKPFSALPITIGEWAGRSEELAEDVLGMLQLTDYVNRYYRRGQDRVNVYVGYYDSQGGRKQIHSPKHCLPGSGWLLDTQGTREIFLEGVGKIRLVVAVYQRDSDRQLFVYWYRLKDAYVTSEYLMKWRMILNSLRYRRNDAAFVRLSTPLPADQGRAFEVVRGFMSEFVPRLEACLPE